jgi:hypothetical protein
MNFIQGTLQMIEVGKGQVLVRLVPMITALIFIIFWCDVQLYHGLDDSQSMDNAQLARQIVRGKGFTTEFLRPHAVAQMRDFAVGQGLKNDAARELFPSDQFPPGTPRIIPDTYNAPGYPYLLATWFYFTRPEFDEPASSIATTHMYSGDRLIPLLNQVFVLLTALIVFILGLRLFDSRVAWMALVAFLCTDLVWKYTMTALSTNVVMFLISASFLCLVEVFCVGEAVFDSEEKSFKAAWIWTLLAALFLGAVCLTRLHLLVLLVPAGLMLGLMPRANYFLIPAFALIVLVLVVPWFLHMKAVCGNPLGSNTPLLLYGQDDYTGNQIYCATSIPSYERLFKDLSKKEYSGFRFHMEHAWNLLGANPLVLLFAVSILHQFKRRRTRLFHWLLFVSAIAIVGVTNFCTDNLEALSPWNTIIVLLPCMLVIGSAYFFILLDRMNLQLWLVNNLIITAALVLTAAPLVLSLTTSSNLFYSFPPYMPPVVKQFAQFAQPDEWVTSDMPWATAWYGDRASLWVPDSLAEFENFHDNVCPSGVLLFTPVTWTQPISSIIAGEYKDWLPLVMGFNAPANFPLAIHTVTGPGGPDYSIWSDRPRWQGR